MKKNTFYYILTIALGIILFSFVLYKSIFISITHDEAGTSWLYKKGVWEIMFAADNFTSANNHILNSLLMKISVSLFGLHVWVLRLPNVLSFILFFLSNVYIINHLTPKKWVQLIGVIILSVNLFVLDFFSLCRGYGLALAFQQVSFAMLFYVVKNNFTKGTWLPFLFGALAVYSNFTWINFYLPLGVLYLFYAWKNKSFQSLSSWISILKYPFIITVILAAFSFKPITYLMHQDEFRWGATSWWESYSSIISCYIYSNEFYIHTIAKWFLLVVFALAAFIFLKTKKNSLGLSVTIMIASIVIFSYLQHWLLHSMFMDGRKALMYIPLISILLFYFFVEITEKNKWLFLLWLPVAFYFIWNPLKFHSNTAVREWWYDENTKNVCYDIAKQTTNQPIKIAMSWEFSSSANYYNMNELKQQLSIIKLDEVQKNDSTIEYYYVLRGNIKDVPKNYTQQKEYSYDNILFKKK